jgi:hypothetical protein
MPLPLMPWYGWVALSATQLIGHLTPVTSYAGATVGYSNPDAIKLQEPLGTFGLQYDIKKRVRIFGEHISSMPEYNDGMGFNHAGIKVLFPVNKRTTAYLGGSIHSQYIDQERTNMSNPIAIAGIEYGTQRFKVYGEFFGSVTDFDKSRVLMGIKYLSH